MDRVAMLLTVSAISGFVIGLKLCRVYAIALFTPVVAVVSAIALRELSFWAAALITYGLIAASQIAYFAGAWLAFSRAEADEDSSNKRAKSKRMLL